MSNMIDRRTLLVRGAGLAALGLGGGLLAACSSGSKGATSAATSTGGSAAATSSGGAAAAGSLGALKFRFDWIKHVEFAGEFIADSSGYFIDEGFSSVDLIAGGPSATPAETDLVQGKAFIGLSSPGITAAAVEQGAPLKIIGATYQKNPYCILSMDSNPIPNPEAMKGKKIGVGAANVAPWQAFLKANNIDPKSLTTVPVQFDPLVLTTGSVDGWFAFSTNEPIALKQKGFAASYFLLADYNYALVGQVFITTQDSIDNKRDALKAVLRADLRGWKDNLTDPTKGATLAVKKYGTNLGLEVGEQTQEAIAANKLIVSSDTVANGLFMMTPELINTNMKIMAAAGSKLTAEQLFDLSLLEEIYKDQPSLITSGVPSKPVGS
jgi:ABC-type nitrate/sulfonate/bicarbonate transport system substrate-binding protein